MQRPDQPVPSPDTHHAAQLPAFTGISGRATGAALEDGEVYIYFEKMFSLHSKERILYNM